jgi:hypothetical protein
MSKKSLFNERFGMLMACASPGSAWAYHLGTNASKKSLVQRGMSVKVHQAAAAGWRNWLSRALDRLEQWSWDRQMERQETYLAQATDLCDLERRMRHLDNPTGNARGEVLR